MKEKRRIEKAIDDVNRMRLWIERPPAVNDGWMYELTDSLNVAVEIMKEKLRDLEEKKNVKS